MIRIYPLIIFIAIVFACADIKAQLSASDALKAIGRGINMGNTPEPPRWRRDMGNPAVVESNFGEYKNVGFTCVRILVTWDKHTATTSPYP